MEISTLVCHFKEELIQIRRDFHKHPELGLREVRTADKVVVYLQDCGLEVVRMNVTGVVGLLRGCSRGPTLLLRADMDALPIHEQNSLPYRSINDGIMHACGHDAHTAILMVAAKILSGFKSTLRGNIKFVFEPNEENVGALEMIKDGVLNNPKVNACMGLHIWNQIPLGQVGITPGPVMAGMEHFDIIIKGKGGHTATPQTAIDPILAAAAIIQGVQIIQTREMDVLKEPTIIMFGKIQGGTAANIIPDSVLLSGTLRFLFEGSDESPNNPKKRLERVVSHICAANKVDYELKYLFGNPPLVNHPEMTNFIRNVASAVTPPLTIVSFSTLVGEDFSEFSARTPGVFFFVGAGKTNENNFPHHHSRFDFDEAAMQIGTELMIRGALQFFELTNEFSFISSGGLNFMFNPFH